jgi:hypothetical protein
MTQAEMLDHVRGRLAPDLDLETFIIGHIGDNELRSLRSRALADDSLPLTFARTVLAEF